MAHDITGMSVSHREHNLLHVISVKNLSLPCIHTYLTLTIVVVDDYNDTVVIIKTRIRENIIISIYVLVRTTYKCRVLLVNPYYILMKLNKLCILVSPRISSSVIRISPAADSGFVTVIYRRSSGPCRTPLEYLVSDLHLLF